MGSIDTATVGTVGGGGGGLGAGGPGGGGSGGLPRLGTVGLHNSNKLGWQRLPDTRFFLGNNLAKFGSNF